MAVGILGDQVPGAGVAAVELVAVVEGRLVAVQGDTLKLDVKGDNREISLDEVRDGRIVIEFKRLDDVETDRVATSDAEGDEG